jgi:hypothetical protein
LLVTKPQKLKRTAYVDTSVLMKEYTEAKDLEQNIKHSLKKRRPKKLKDSNKLLIFKSSANTVRAQQQKECKATILCAASIIAANKKKWNRNGHISKRVKFIKAYGKKKRIFLYLRYG